MNVLIDTNIALYLLGGDETLRDMLDGQVVHLPFISELEHSKEGVHVPS